MMMNIMTPIMRSTHSEKENRRSGLPDVSIVEMKGIMAKIARKPPQSVVNVIGLEEIIRNLVPSFVRSGLLMKLLPPEREKPAQLERSGCSSCR